MKKSNKYVFISKAANQVVKEVLARRIGNDHHRKEGNERGKDHAVNEDDQPGLLQVGQLGMLDFAIDLGERLLAAHSQDGVPEGDENPQQADRVGKAAVTQPSQRVGGEMEMPQRRQRWQVGASYPYRKS